MTKRLTEVPIIDSTNVLNKYTKNNVESSKQTLGKYVSGVKPEEESKDTENVNVKQPVKKNRINLKNIEDISANKKVANTQISEDKYQI
jgi:hypothetical protein